jgi:hypothetical protein
MHLLGACIFNLKNNFSIMEFTRINNDVNGNPRYVVHFFNLLTEGEKNNTVAMLSLSGIYDLAVYKAKKIGGKKFHNKQYGGGIVFQSYSLPELEKNIIEARG